MRSERFSEGRWIALAAILLLPGCTVSAKPRSGGFLVVKVGKVLDGDTFHGVLMEGEVPSKVKRMRGNTISIRLQGIDAPEHDQPWGDSSRAALERELATGRIRVEIVAIDRYRRVVGNVRRDSLDVCARMVAGGHAWMFRRYTDAPLLDSLESAARLGRKGLWKTGDPVAPWLWRKAKRSSERSP